MKANYPEDQDRITHEGHHTSSFVFYESWLDAIIDIQDKEVQAECFLALAMYGIRGSIDNIKKGSMAWVLLQSCKGQIDANFRKRIGGAAGGRPRKPKEEPVPQEPRKRGRPKKAAAVPESTLDTVVRIP